MGGIQTLLGGTGEMEAEAIELRNWLLHFGCAQEDLRFIFADLANWMANSSHPWAAYHALMACCLIALDMRPGVSSVGIGETLCQAIAKLAVRAARDQAKTVYFSLQMCVGLEAGTEGATHTKA